METNYEETSITEYDTLDCMTVEEAIEYTCQSVKKIYEEAGEL